jgi:dienelactone hydrolase
MNPITFFKSLLILTTMVNMSANASSPSPSIKEESVTYSANGVTLKGLIVYDSNVKGKRPAVIVIPEWWGLNDYAKMRARMLAELGYVAMAADMFGDGKIAADPGEAQSFTMPFYQDPQLAKTRLDAAIVKIRGFA